MNGPAEARSEAGFAYLDAARVPAEQPVPTGMPGPAASPSRRLRDRPLAIAHRGFDPDGRENSLDAFRGALATGATYLETDVRAASDGTLMAFHDATLERVTDGMGPLSLLSAGDLRKLRIRGAGPIPTMEELLTELPDARFNIDLKDEASPDLLAELIERHQAHDRVLVASFSDRRRLRLLARLSRPVATSPGRTLLAALVAPVPAALVRRIAAAGRFQCVQVPYRYRGVTVPSPSFIRRCHRAGLQVHVWTVNDPDVMSLLLDRGVDGIITDRIDVLARLLRARGEWSGGPPLS